MAPAKVADCRTPKRVSVPSVALPTAWGTVPLCTPWRTLSTTMLPTAITAIAATIA